MSWTHASFHGGDILQYSMGLFFVQLTWSHFWSILLLGQRDERFISVVYILEVLSVVAIYLRINDSNGSLTLAYNISLLFVTNWAFPLRYLYIRKLL